MGKPRGINRGLKRHKSLDKSDVAKHSKRKTDVVAPTHNGSELSSSEGEDKCSGAMGVDKLLKVLGSSNKELAMLNKRREREQEGRSDTEEDEDVGYGSDMVSEEEDGDEGGSGSETSLEDAESDDLTENVASDTMEQREEDRSGAMDGSSSGDDLSDSESDSQTNADKTESTSSFHRHLEHILTNEEAEKLLKSRSKFQWDMPAVGMLMSKCLGTGERLPEEVNSDIGSELKPKLYNYWLDIFKTSGSGDFGTSRLRFFLSLCSTYRDIMHCIKKPFYRKGSEEDSNITDAYLMHALNHVFKTRDLVLKNDRKFNKHQESNEDEILYGGTFLDQGFTRPKVMILLPLRSIALRVVKRLIHLTPLSQKSNVEYFGRFSEEFGAADDEEDDESSKRLKSAKPKDFQLLFGGNNDDCFFIGIKFTKRTVKLYSDFYSSDIIIASPIGLIKKIADSEAEKEKDVDYLSSIEVLIIDNADVIALQNWSHLDTVVEQLNHTPSKQHGTDVMRIRQWYLDGHARFYRQTILLGSFLNPDMNAFFNRLCVNYEGKLKLTSEYKGVLPKVLLPVRQVYDRFDASIIDVHDARFDYFCKKVFPKINDSMEGGTMLFISSYFEYVRIRNFLKSQDASFCLLGDYTLPSDISRARVWFFEGKRKIMLYTERAHFYHRYKIRGIKNLIIYSLPETKEFYPEILNMLEGSTNMTCNVIFSRFDHLKLERIVGTSSAKRMVSSDKDIFVFC